MSAVVTSKSEVLQMTWFLLLSKGFITNDETSKNYKLIIIHFNYPFLCIISAGCYVKWVRQNRKVSRNVVVILRAAVAQAVQCLTTGWTIGVRSPTGAPASRPALGPTQPPIQWVPGVKRGRGVTLTAYLHLVPRLKMRSRDYTSSHPQTPPWRVAGQLSLVVIFVIVYEKKIIQIEFVCIFIIGPHTKFRRPSWVLQQLPPPYWHAWSPCCVLYYTETKDTNKVSYFSKIRVGLCYHKNLSILQKWNSELRGSHMLVLLMRGN
jgi:hypothetical protein